MIQRNKLRLNFKKIYQSDVNKKKKTLLARN
jgi:hypothetical protein